MKLVHFADGGGGGSLLERGSGAAVQPGINVSRRTGGSTTAGGICELVGAGIAAGGGGGKREDGCANPAGSGY